MLPAKRTFLDIRIIAFGVITVIPVTRWKLLLRWWRLLNVDWRRYRYGNYSRRIIRIPIRVIRVIWGIQIKAII